MVYVKYLQCIQDGKMSKFSQNIDNIRFLGSLSMWIGISLIISFVISLILPFPWSLAVAICIFLLIYYCYVMRKLSKRIGNGYSANSMFSSLSSPFDSSSGSHMLSKYYCISCGAQHAQVSCPKCGSKIRKLGL